LGGRAQIERMRRKMGDFQPIGTNTSGFYMTYIV
jgi:hypothetical protein